MKNQKGFTLIELLIVISIMAILTGLATVNLTGAQRRVSLQTATSTLVTDLRQQQIKAMIGDAEGNATSDSHGIHFDQTQYVLFHGDTYDSLDTSNAVITLENSIEFANPNTDVIFERVSGETAAIDIPVENVTNNKQKIIQLSDLGVVTAVN